eukprot:TRINITY_DN21181_c0_g1_i1.p1 TRINITY_DN21181_c0_g1~~TRINITY_DN21181_c0_g1_i1.p1  ORF type:complete len:805 (-),score=97.16 TRINITY_DN21181_c0_g1_i1:309-2723(-)
MAVAKFPPAAGNTREATLLQIAFDVLMPLQTEIIIFVIALIMHPLVFGRYRTLIRSQKQKGCLKQSPPQAGSSGSVGKFDTDAFLSLLSRVRSCCEFEQLLDKASEHGSFASTLRKAAEVALERCDQALADAVTSRLPKSKSEIEQQSMGTVAVLLRVPDAVARRQGQTGCEAGQKVMEFYENHLSELDISNHAAAEMTLLDAALSCERTDVVAKLLEPAGQGRQATTLRRFGAKGRLSDVIRVMGGYPQITCHQAWLEGAIMGGDMIMANEIFGQAEKSGNLGSPLYVTMLKARLESQNVSEARALIRRMSSCGVTLPTGSHNELVRVTSEHCREQFFDLLGEMQACGLMPNTKTAALILNVVQQKARSDDLERMIEFFECLADDMDENVFSVVIKACLRSDRSDLLASVVERHWEARTLPSSVVHAYGSAIRAYGCLRQVEKIWVTWRSMRAHDLKLTSVAIGCMVEALVSNGLPDDGYQLLRELREDEIVRPLLNAVIYCSVLKGFAHQQSFARTWAVYLEMLEDRLEFSIVTFNALIDACARCGEMSRVPQLLDSMSCQNIEPTLITYCAILKGYCRGNQIESAFELVETMRRTTSLVPDEIMYNTLLDGCARSGLFNRGLQVLAEMEAAHVNPSNFTLSLLMKLAGRSRQLETAFELFENIPRRFHFQPNVHAYANLILACLQHHALPRAMALLDKMAQVRMRPDSRLYGMLIRACISSGDLRTAEGLVRAAFGLKGGYSGLLSLKDARSHLRSEMSELFDAMAKRNDPSLVELARDLQRVARFEMDSSSKIRFIAALS